MVRLVDWLRWVVETYQISMVSVFFSCWIWSNFTENVHHPKKGKFPQKCCDVFLHSGTEKTYPCIRRFTPLKFGQFAPKDRLAPKRKLIFQPILFQGRAVNFLGVYLGYNPTKKHCHFRSSYLGAISLRSWNLLGHGRTDRDGSPGPSFAQCRRCGFAWWKGEATSGDQAKLGRWVHMSGDCIKQVF